MLNAIDVILTPAYENCQPMIRRRKPIGYWRTELIMLPSYAGIAVLFLGLVDTTWFLTVIPVLLIFATIFKPVLERSLESSPTNKQAIAKTVFIFLGQIVFWTLIVLYSSAVISNGENVAITRLHVQLSCS